MTGQQVAPGLSLALVAAVDDQQLFTRTVNEFGFLPAISSLFFFGLDIVTNARKYLRGADENEQLHLSSSFARIAGKAGPHWDGDHEGTERFFDFAVLFSGQAHTLDHGTPGTFVQLEGHLHPGHTPAEHAEYLRAAASYIRRCVELEAQYTGRTFGDALNHYRQVHLNHIARIDPA